MAYEWEAKRTPDKQFEFICAGGRKPTQKEILEVLDANRRGLEGSDAPPWIKEVLGDLTDRIVDAKKEEFADHFRSKNSLRAEHKVSEDQVNRPSHYNAGGLEAIDALKASVTPEEFAAHCRLTSMKYIWRCTHKGKLEQDIQKAIWYLRFSIGDDPRED